MLLGWRKAKSKEAHDEVVTWEDRDGLRFRRYESYDQYVRHQASKLATLDLSNYTKAFKKALEERLSNLTELPHGSSVLCLGARNGAECQVFLERGMFAVGVDLNPGPDNRWVLPGDFHHLQFANDTVDAIFTNALDHALNLEKVLLEVKRVLKPNGLFIAEIVEGSADRNGREPGKFESAWWNHVDDVVQNISASGFSMSRRSGFEYPWRGEHLVFKK